MKRTVMASIETDKLRAVVDTMRARIMSALAIGRLDIAQDSRLILDSAIQELKRRKGNRDII